MGAQPRIGIGRLTLAILLLMLLGIPMVAYLWETLNRVFAGIVEPTRLLLSVPILLLLIGLLLVVSRLVMRWEGDRRDSITETSARS